jgi:SAM-dependent methyltransferase
MGAGPHDPPADPASNAAPNAAPNAAQADYWNADAGRTWAELQVLLDLELQPLGEEALRVPAPRAAERVLDIGCGAGETSLELARAVGPQGSVLGVDLSAPLLDLARRRAAAAGLPVRFVRADAQTANLTADLTADLAAVSEAAVSGSAFGDGHFDAVYSRFGVMFFADPAAAFANIRAALRPGGRLAFVCWRAFEANPLMREPLEAALPFIPPPEPVDPAAPGPFAFADPQKVRDILGAAGLARIRVEPFDAQVGGWTMEEALIVAQRVGPLGFILRHNPGLRRSVLDAVAEALARHRQADGRIRLGAAVWIVSAIRPDALDLKA